MSSSSPILVFGATGRVGGEILRQLVAHNVSVAAAVRDTTKAAKQFPTGVSVVHADLNDAASVSKAVTEAKAKHAFLYSQPGGMKQTVDALKAGGLQHVVFLSTTFIDDGLLPDVVGGVTETHMSAEATIRASGLTYTFLRAGAFASNSVHWKYGIPYGVVKTPFPEAASAVVAEEDIAAIAVKALTTNKLDNQTLSFNGPELLTQRQQIEIVSSVIGKPLQIIQISEQEYGEMVKNLSEPVIQTLIAYYKYATTNKEDTSSSAIIQEHAGRPPIKFKEYAQKHKHEYSM